MSCFYCSIGYTFSSGCTKNLTKHYAVFLCNALIDVHLLKIDMKEVGKHSIRMLLNVQKAKLYQRP